MTKLELRHEGTDRMSVPPASVFHFVSNGELYAESVAAEADFYFPAAGGLEARPAGGGSPECSDHGALPPMDVGRAEGASSSADGGRV